jgi:predicted lipid-binding transport protein (Tim44 family)
MVMREEHSGKVARTKTTEPKLGEELWTLQRMTAVDEPSSSRSAIQEIDVRHPKQ